MIRNSKLVIAAIAAACIASPALAQAYDPDAGSGNLVPLNAGQTAPQNGKIAVHRSGLRAYALIQREAATGTATDRPVNGRGSAGYNDHVLK